MLAAHFCLDIPSMGPSHEKYQAGLVGVGIGENNRRRRQDRQGEQVGWSFCCAVLETGNL